MSVFCSDSDTPENTLSNTTNLLFWRYICAYTPCQFLFTRAAVFRDLQWNWVYFYFRMVNEFLKISKLKILPPFSPNGASLQLLPALVLTKKTMRYTTCWCVYNKFTFHTRILYKLCRFLCRLRHFNHSNLVPGPKLFAYYRNKRFCIVTPARGFRNKGPRKDEIYSPFLLSSGTSGN